MVTIRTLYREAHDDSIFVCGVVAVKSTLVPFKLQTSNFCTKKRARRFCTWPRRTYVFCLLPAGRSTARYVPSFPSSLSREPPPPPYTYCMYPFEAVQ